MRVLLILLTVLLAVSSPAQTLPATIIGFAHPESVCQSGQTLYVSNIGTELDPSKKDGDGFISKVDLATGQITELHFLGGDGSGLVLHAPKGMAIKGHILYVTDVDRVLGFDVKSRKQVMEIAIPGTSFLNDLVMGNGLLYASATDNGKIYVIDPQKQTCAPLSLPDTVTGANGLLYDGASSTLYCVTVGVWGTFDGKVCAIDLKHLRVRVLCDYRGLLDGVDRIGDTLYFSDWKSPQDKGLLLALDLRSQRIKPVLLPYGPIAGPADFCISADRRYFIIPATVEGKVIIQPVGR